MDTVKLKLSLLIAAIAASIGGVAIALTLLMLGLITAEVSTVVVTVCALVGVMSIFQLGRWLFAWHIGPISLTGALLTFLAMCAFGGITIEAVLKRPNVAGVEPIAPFIIMLASALLATIGTANCFRRLSKARRSFPRSLP